MVTSVISLAIFALILWFIYFLVGKFIEGVLLQIVGIIFGLVFLVKALHVLGISI